MVHFFLQAFLNCSSRSTFRSSPNSEVLNLHILFAFTSWIHLEIWACFLSPLPAFADWSVPNVWNHKNLQAFWLFTVGQIEPYESSQNCVFFNVKAEEIHQMFGKIIASFLAKLWLRARQLKSCRVLPGIWGVMWRWLLVFDGDLSIKGSAILPCLAKGDSCWDEHRHQLEASTTKSPSG